MNMNKLAKLMALYNMNELSRQYGLSSWLQQKVRRGQSGLNAGSLELLKTFAQMQLEAWQEVIND